MVVCGAELDPDSRPPTNVAQRFANGIHVFYKWTKTPEALVRAFTSCNSCTCSWCGVDVGAVHLPLRRAVDRALDPRGSS